MFKRLIVLILLLSLLCIPQSPAIAQTDDTQGAVYIVQPGDTLGEIAARLGVTVQDLIDANQLENPNAISAGQSLKVPGLEGFTGVLTTQTVQLGETLESLSFKYNMPVDTLANLNRIVSSSEIYAGTQLIIVENEENNPLQPSFSLNPHQSILELAVQHNSDPWKILSDNRIDSQWLALPGEIFFAQGENNSEISSISPWIKEIEISPLPLVQGKTTEIKLTTNQPLQLTGELAGNTLHFSSVGENEYIALQGINAMAQPGLESFVIASSDEGSTNFDFSQQVLLESGGYPDATALIVDPTTIDPAVTQPEEDLINQIVAPYTDPKRWTDTFSYLTDEPCVNAWFGYRRSYNGGPYDFYHTGVDFGICAQNLNIYAPAPGKVVYTGSLVVRGNATIIDHGHGVYSGIWHQEEILVNVGDEVETGQKIGIIGNTGRSTGPHLHWELWVNGVQVNPLDWLETNF